VRAWIDLFRGFCHFHVRQGQTALDNFLAVVLSHCLFPTMTVAKSGRGECPIPLLRAAADTVNHCFGGVQ
jgi:hypothetical protein